MTEIEGREVVVAGAGALGLTTALRLADAGAHVVLADPAAFAANASGVAAGMLAPVSETLLDPEGGAHLQLLTAARERWPRLAARIGLEDRLDRSGALVTGDAAFLQAAADRLQSLGLQPQPLGARELQSLQPGLKAAAALLTAEDWRIDAAAALAGLLAAFRALGGVTTTAPVEASHGRVLLDGEPIQGDLVIATGAAEGLLPAAPELAVLSPIKGQLLRFDAGPHSGPVVRGQGGYVAPHVGGALVGATMEPGRRDLDVDPALLEGLRAEAARLFPHLADAPWRARAGVRATTPDGLPLVGRSSGSVQAVLCVGARRNGWLLAPLAAEKVLEALVGAPADPAFDPGRFS